MLQTAASLFRDRDRFNVLVLSICQCLFGSARALLMSTAPIIAYAIAVNKGLATLPASLVVVGTALSTLPASMFMRRVGRRAGFIVGALIGAAGGVMSAWALVIFDFWLFAAGALMFGFFSGFAQLYRFAAADAAPKDFRATAISLVLAGGVVAAFVGPELAKVGQHFFAAAEFLGAYVFMVGMCLATGVVLMFLNIPDLTEEEKAGPQRPMGEIMRQPIFVASVLTMMMAQGVMNLLMTATPIAMIHESHSFPDTAFVIEWHIFGMFAPGFFTGNLIKRFGEIAISWAGMAMQLACVVVAFLSQDVMGFWLSMFLLGVGWNFAFTAGSALLTDAYTPSERAKTQGMASMLIYIFVAIGSLSSGAVVHYFGWQMVNAVSIPFLMIAAGATIWLGLNRKSQRETAAPV